MHLFSLIRMAYKPHALVKQHDVLILVEDRQLWTDLGVERILPFNFLKELILHIHLNHRALGEHSFLIAAFSIDAHTAKAQKLPDMTRRSRRHGLLKKTGQPAAFPCFINSDGFHSENLSLITRITPLSSLDGATYLQTAFTSSRPFAIA